MRRFAPLVSVTAAVLAFSICCFVAPVTAAGPSKTTASPQLAGYVIPDANGFMNVWFTVLLLVPAQVSSLSKPDSSIKALWVA
jgi:hypothetical protein